MSLQLRKTLAAIAILGSLCVSQQALAHAHLIQATPADKSVVNNSLKELTLKFTEGLEPAFSSVDVTSNNGSHVSAGKAMVDSKDNTVMHVPLTLPLKTGSYMVDWHALSVDGHKTQGMYTFTVK